ncbi:MAG: shikimate kinase, partial [Candidatus Helarchaeota archaeon]
MIKSNIALIGFMGTGKTTIGKLVAKKLGKKFIEMD